MHLSAISQIKKGVRENGTKKKHFIKNMKFLVNGHRVRHSSTNSACWLQMKIWLLILAQENFMRREPVADIWIVNRKDVRKMDAEEKLTLGRLDNKDYRTTKGYGYLKKKWRHYEQEMLDEKEILSWGGERK